MNTTESNAERFIQTHKELEHAIRDRWELDRNESALTFLAGQRTFADQKNIITTCRDVRNLLQHTPKVGNAYPIEPSNELITALENLLDRVANPVRCMDRAIKAADLFTCTGTDRIGDVMTVMDKQGYTCTPLLEDGHVVGVFNGTALFHHFVSVRVVDENSPISTLGDALSLEGRDAERFVFLSRGALLEDLVEQFEAAHKRGQHIQLAFITESGAPNQRILGMLTPWDIIGANE